MLAVVESVTTPPARHGCHPNRTTFLQALTQHGPEPFRDAGRLNGSYIVHLIQFTVRPDHPIGTARCGYHGIVGPARWEDLVCLRCWPWWTYDGKPREIPDWAADQLPRHQRRP